MTQPRVIDISGASNDEKFIKTAHQIELAIRVKINDQLQPQFNSYMTEIRGELDGLSPEAAANLFLNIFINNNLDPKSLLVRQCLELADETKSEIEALRAIGNNLHSTYQYVLNYAQVRRFGLTGTEAMFK